jgi:peptide/nickel transport system ATP-binding protein
MHMTADPPLRMLPATPAAPLLSVEGLGVSFHTVPVTQDITFAIAPGERVGMVGESGCGKSVTGLALLRLLPRRAAHLSGRVVFEGQDLLQASAREMRRVRGGRIGMIFQEPMSALDPVFTIGEQIAETLRTHRGLNRPQAMDRAVEVLDAVGIPLPRRRAESYPHQLSGGMRQRAMIAIALACEPALLIADEPTTALDVTVQAQIIDLLVSLSDRTGTALLFITHDLGVIAETCTRVLTLYAGQVVEDAPAETLLTRPRHPYTSGLLRSLPRLSERKTRLPSITGRVPAPMAMPPGCRFAPRCPYVEPACEAPQGLDRLPGAAVRCCRHGELALPGAA